MIDLELAQLDPQRVFKHPQAVVDSTELTRDQKKHILQQWALDEMELAVATEENMPGKGSDPGMFDEVLKALHDLGYEISTRKTLNDKHGDIVIVSKDEKK